MKVVKEKKIKQKKTGKEGTGKVRRTWKRSNDKVRDVLHSVAFLSPSVTGVAVFFILPFLVVVYSSVRRLVYSFSGPVTGLCSSIQSMYSFT